MKIVLVFFFLFGGVFCFFDFGFFQNPCNPAHHNVLSDYICDCPIYPDYFNKLTKSLQNFFGQEQVVRLVLEKIRLHDFGDNAKHPTALHFAGDNGVGKTLISKIIANAIYSKKIGNLNMPKGLLYVRGNRYRGVSSGVDIEKYRNDLRNQVIQHLFNCPQGLIVIDEVELINPSIIAIFQEFLDSTHPYIVHEGKQAKLSQAIYIFITDFSEEGRTEGMTLNEIIHLVHEVSLLKWQDPKQTALIPWIIPFAPINEKGLQDHVNYLVNSLNEHSKILAFPFRTDFSISSSSRSNLIEITKKMYKDETKCYKNYRGVEEIFDDIVLSKVLTEISDIQPGNFNLKVILVVDEEVSLQITKKVKTEDL